MCFQLLSTKNSISLGVTQKQLCLFDLSAFSDEALSDLITYIYTGRYYQVQLKILHHSKNYFGENGPENIEFTKINK